VAACGQKWCSPAREASLPVPMPPEVLPGTEYPWQWGWGFMGGHFSSSLSRAGNEGNLLHGREYPPGCPAGCLVAVEGHPNVAHSPCSVGARLFLSLEGQSRTGAVSWQTPTGTSLLCSGLSGCSRALGPAAGSGPHSIQCVLKISMREQHHSQSLLSLSLLSLNFLPCSSPPP